MTTANLTKQILDTIRAAGKPVSAAEIRRALPGLVDASEISGRLKKLANRGDILAIQAKATALTGPRKIKLYTTPDAPQLPLIPEIDGGSQDWNIFQLLPEPLQMRDDSFG